MDLADLLMLVQKGWLKVGRHCVWNLSLCGLEFVGQVVDFFNQKFSFSFVGLEVFFHLLGLEDHFVDQDLLVGLESVFGQRVDDLLGSIEKLFGI